LGATPTRVAVNEDFGALKTNASKTTSDERVRKIAFRASRLTRQISGIRQASDVDRIRVFGDGRKRNACDKTARSRTTNRAGDKRLDEDKALFCSLRSKS
jgi:hypothetical protein